MLQSDMPQADLQNDQLTHTQATPLALEQGLNRKSGQGVAQDREQSRS
jgi:hypothetical protein